MLVPARSERAGVAHRALDVGAQERDRSGRESGPWAGHCVLIRSASVASIAIDASGRSRRIARRPSPPITSARAPCEAGRDRRSARGCRGGRPARRCGRRPRSRGSGVPSRRLAARDVDVALEQHEQLVADLALPEDRLVRLERALGGRHRDPLEVLRLEPTEQGDAPQPEHRLEVLEGRRRVRHLGLLARGTPCQPADPRVLIIAQLGEGFVSGCVVSARPVLHEPGQRATEPSIADRVECLDRLGANVGVVGADAPPDHATGGRRPEHRHRTERQVLVALDPPRENVAEDRRIASSSAGGALDRARSPSRGRRARGPTPRGQSPGRPCLSAHACTTGATSARWPSIARRAASCASGEPRVSTSMIAAGSLGRADRASAAAAPHDGAGSARPTTSASGVVAGHPVRRGSPSPRLGRLGDGIAEVSRGQLRSAATDRAVPARRAPATHSAVPPGSSSSRTASAPVRGLSATSPPWSERADRRGPRTPGSTSSSAPTSAARASGDVERASRDAAIALVPMFRRAEGLDERGPDIRGGDEVRRAPDRPRAAVRRHPTAGLQQAVDVAPPDRDHDRGEDRPPSPARARTPGRVREIARRSAAGRPRAPSRSGPARRPGTPGPAPGGRRAPRCRTRSTRRSRGRVGPTAGRTRGPRPSRTRTG